MKITFQQIFDRNNAGLLWRLSKHQRKQNRTKWAKHQNYVQYSNMFQWLSNACVCVCWIKYQQTPRSRLSFIFLSSFIRLNPLSNSKEKTKQLPLLHLSTPTQLAKRTAEKPSLPRLLRRRTWWSPSSAPGAWYRKAPLGSWESLGLWAQDWKSVASVGCKSLVYRLAEWRCATFCRSWIYNVPFLFGSIQEHHLPTPKGCPVPTSVVGVLLPVGFSTGPRSKSTCASQLHGLRKTTWLSPKPPAHGSNSLFTKVAKIPPCSSLVRVIDLLPNSPRLFFFVFGMGQWPKTLTH